MEAFRRLFWQQQHLATQFFPLITKVMECQVCEVRFSDDEKPQCRS